MTPSGVLKGGFALELRYGWFHRPTRDIDLRFANGVELDSLVDALRATSAVQDGFTYEFGEVSRELRGGPGGSLRVSVVARLAGQVFAHFRLDLSRGDALVGEPDMLEGSAQLAFVPTLTGRCTGMRTDLLPGTQRDRPSQTRIPVTSPQ